MLKEIHIKIFIVLILLNIPNVKGQESFPTNYFRVPVDIPVYLSGTFGELRSNHFHTGIDIKTQGEQGKKIYAVADGYVSRLNISPYGYGKAVYITHPNSYVSVYAHLKSFGDVIESYVKNHQYSNETYAFDKNIGPEVIKVSKGDVIGYSGNTGSSGGPHLHFEIRERNTQYPVNPILFGYKITDNISPHISTLKLYVMDDLSSIDNKNEDKSYSVKKSGSNFKTDRNDTITVSGNISFGIRTFDRLNGANNKNGVYSIELFVDSVCIWSYEMNKLSFYQTRYINTLLDYPAYVRSRRRIQRSWISPHNPLMIYDKTRNNGSFDFSNEKVYDIRYVVSDHFGNTSELKFVIQAESNVGNNNNGFHKIKDKGYVFLYEKDNSFEREDVILNVPAKALYDDIVFEYESEERCNSCISKIHHIHNIYTPLHKYSELSIKADTIIPTSLQSKAILVEITEKGRKNSIGGEWKDGFVMASTRSFGNYTIMLDTVQPVIKAVNLYPGKKITTQNTLVLRIYDELSGIKSYRGTLNGKWILMEYNVNKDRLIYNFDDRFLKGKNSFKLVVVDNKDNKTEYKATLIR